MVPSTYASAGANYTSGALTPEVDLTLDDPLDEEPMPIPSTWSRTAVVPREPNRSNEFRYGLLGFGIGLCIVIPTVMIATGDIGLPVGAPQGDAEIAVAATSENPDQASSFATATTTPSLGLAFAGRPVDAAGNGDRFLALPEPESAIQKLVVTPVTAAPETGSGRTNPNPELVVMEARGLIAGGEVLEARALLEGARSTASGKVLFLLGETYDPKQLEEWGVATIQGDVDKARGIYMLAMLAGVERAGDRIRGLQQP